MHAPSFRRLAPARSIARRASTSNVVLNSVALAALLAGAPASFAHDDAHAPKASAATPKVQKDWGIAGDAKSAKRTIEVSMADTMRFTPDRIELRQGETVRFVVRNGGAVLHEFVLGTKQENDTHAAMMLKMPGMEHEAPWMAHVPPGKTAEIVWTFNRAGTFDFACLIAGHYQAGMRGTVVVAAK